MKSALRPHHQALILILILLIHGSMLMVFIAAEFSSSAHEALIMIEDQPDNQLSNQDWVALNNSLPLAQMIAQEATQHVEEQPSSEPSSELVEQTDTAPSVGQQSAQQHSPQEELIAQEQEIDEAIAIASRLLEPEQKKKPEESIEEFKKEPPAEQSPPLTHSATTPPPSSKQMPSFAQLAQGFVEHLQHAEMAVRSDRKGVASIDQIKHLNYCQKIIGCIVNSYKIHNHGAPKKLLAHQARIQLVLNRNGSIAQLQLQQSSGDISVDRFLLDMFQDAGSSFPPVPNALKENPYVLPTFSVDSLESFNSTQGWYIDNKSI